MVNITIIDYNKNAELSEAMSHLVPFHASNLKAFRRSKCSFCKCQIVRPMQGFPVSFYHSRFPLLFFFSSLKQAQLEYLRKSYE